MSEIQYHLLILTCFFVAGLIAIWKHVRLKEANETIRRTEANLRITTEQLVDSENRTISAAHEIEQCFENCGLKLPDARGLDPALSAYSFGKIWGFEFHDAIAEWLNGKDFRKEENQFWLNR